MDDAPDNRELAHRFALLEARMDTQLAKNESAIDRMNALIADLKTENANRGKEAATRDKATIQWIAGLVFGATVLIIAVLGLLIRWPAPPV